MHSYNNGAALNGKEHRDTAGPERWRKRLQNHLPALSRAITAPSVFPAHVAAKTRGAGGRRAVVEIMVEPSKQMGSSSYVCVWVCRYLYVRMYVRRYVRTYVHMYVCLSVCMYVCMYVYINLHISIYIDKLVGQGYIYVYMRACFKECVYIYVYISVCSGSTVIYYTYVYIYITYVCVYIYIHVYAGYREQTIFCLLGSPSPFENRCSGAANLTPEPSPQPPEARTPRFPRRWPPALRESTWEFTGAFASMLDQADSD